MNRSKCVILVPIYKEKFDFDEYNSVKQLFKILPVEKYDIIAFGPQSLDRTYYYENFNFTKHFVFYDSYFTNYPSGYNSLLLNPGFYNYFSEYEYMLIYQPDAWVFRDELEYWCNKGYDFIGAPLMFFDIPNCHSNCIGNGGFSLRKIKFWINLCTKYKDVADILILSNNDHIGEDRIIDILLDHYKLDIKLPTYIEASKFSFEINPHLLYQMTEHQLPFGCHAYNKITDKEFWNDFIFYNKKLYSVVTYIFDQNDVLKDPDEVDEAAEYICITDRDDLESNVWTIKKLDYPNADQYNATQKTMIARYTALNYISTEYCVQMDSTIHIKKSFRNLIYQFKSRYVGILIVKNLSNNINYLDEYNELIRTSKLDTIQKDNFIKFCNDHNYDINSRGIVTTKFFIKKKNNDVAKLDNCVLNELLNNFNFSECIDYTYFSILFSNIFYRSISFLIYSPQILNSDYFEYTGNDVYNKEYELDKIECGYLNNLEHFCSYLI